MNTSLIQYMSSGIRRFKTKPILQHTRLNWEFYAVIQGRCGVLLDRDEKLVAAVPSSGILERRLTAVQCRQIEAIERAIEPKFHNPTPLSELYFHRAVIDLSLIALGGKLPSAGGAVSMGMSGSVRRTLDLEIRS
jgi:hypothetical protein